MTDPRKGEAPAHPKNDARSVDELISVVLSGPDEDAAWEAVWALHWRGFEEVFDRAARLCRSPCAVERRAGANVLGQLRVPDRTFPGPSLRVLLNMLEVERDDDTLQSVLVALSHLKGRESLAPVSRFRRHAHPDVRHGVVLVMSGHNDPRALEVLMELTDDEEAYVRDWATSALGSLTEADTPALRDALVRRLSDEDDGVRAEALVGLARRGDRRVLPFLVRELASESVGTLAVEAATLIGEPQLLPQLVALKGWWDVDEKLLDEAVRVYSHRREVAT